MAFGKHLDPKGLRKPLGSFSVGGWVSTPGCFLPTGTSFRLSQTHPRGTEDRQVDLTSGLYGGGPNCLTVWACAMVRWGRVPAGGRPLRGGEGKQGGGGARSFHRCNAPRRCVAPACTSSAQPSQVLRYAASALGDAFGDARCIIWSTLPRASIRRSAVLRSIDASLVGPPGQRGLPSGDGSGASQRSTRSLTRSGWRRGRQSGR